MHPKRLILWILWFAITTGFCLIYFLFGRNDRAAASSDGDFLRYFPLIPLGVSVAIRFFLLPKFKSLNKVLPIYIIGLSLAEGSGIVATFLLSSHDAANIFGASLIALLMYIPLFSNKLEIS